MQFFTLGRNTYSFPSRWNELTPHQVRKLAALLNSGVTYDKFIVKALKICSGRPWWQLLLYSMDVCDQQHLVEFVLTDTLTKNPQPYYRSMQGVEDELADMCTTEYFFANHFFSLWQKKQDADYLNKFIATIYRPMHWRYDNETMRWQNKKEPYNDAHTDRYTQKVQHWPMPVKLAIAKFFEGAVLALQQKYPEPFRPGGTVAQFGFYECIRMVAENGVHGQMKQVETLPIHTFLIDLTVILKQAEAK